MLLTKQKHRLGRVAVRPRSLHLELRPLHCSTVYFLRSSYLVTNHLLRPVAAHDLIHDLPLSSHHTLNIFDPVDRYT